MGVLAHKEMLKPILGGSFPERFNRVVCNEALAAELDGSERSIVNQLVKPRSADARNSDGFVRRDPNRLR